MAEAENISDNAYARIGKELRDARVAKKLEIPQVSRELHIRTQYIAALEAGEVSELPSGAYLQGYLHRYAWFLGLDADDIVRRFERSGELPSRRLFALPQSIRKNQQPSPHTVLISFVCGLFIAGLWVSLNPSVLPPVHSDVTESFFQRPMPRAEAVDCMGETVGVWPPCYHADTHKDKVRSVMELYK